MFGYRLLYAVTLMAVFIFYLAYSPWFSWYLLVLVLLVVPFDLAVSLPGMLSKSIKTSAPPFLEKNAKGALTISSVSRKPFPVRCLHMKLAIIGDYFVVHERLHAPAYDGGCVDIPIDTSQTGLTVFKVDRFRAVSLIGLFSMKINTECNSSVLVLPPPSKPDNTLELPRSLILKPKPGGGFSEEHDMRSYRPGDPVRSVHWKLSAKYDSLIIREPLIPPQQSRLVHVIPWDDAGQRESTLSHLRWVSDYLINKGLSYHIKFGDRPVVDEISSENDLVHFLRKVLDSSATLKPVLYPKLTRFSWVYKIKS